MHLEIDRIDFRFSVLDDAALLEQWLADSRLQDIVLPKDEEERLFFLNIWKSLLKRQACLTMTLDGKPIAIATLYLMYYWKVSFASYGMVAMDPDYSLEETMPPLLKNFKHLAGRYFQIDTLYLEVYGNPPRLAPFLEGAGFDKVFEQSGYFKYDGVELARVLYEIRGLS